MLTLGLCTAVDAAPHATFAGLFHAGKTKLACVGAPVTELTCTIYDVNVKGGIRYSRLACAGDLQRIHSDLWEPFQPVVLAGTDHGVWRSETADKLDLKQPAWLAIPPAQSHWREDDDPQAYAGTQHFTLPHGHDWCAAWWPFGSGGAPKAYAICISPDGTLAGIAAIKTEGKTWSIRCGAAPEPETLLPRNLKP